MSPDTQSTIDGKAQQTGARVGSKAPTAIVVGSGFGGLAAAVRLAARGYRVRLLEKRDQLGGRAYVYRDEGYVFDAGPTVVTAPFLFEELWNLAGRSLADDVDLRPVDPFYRIRFDDGDSFDYSGDADRMRAEIRRISPSDLDGYERFLVESEKIFNKGFTELADAPFGRFADMMKIVPAMIRLGSHRSVASLAAQHVKHEKLRQVLSFHPLLVGGNPYRTTSIYSLILFLERKWGVWFPIGGTGALVQGLAKLIEQMGGEIELNAEVEEIEVQNGRARGVRLADGRRINGDIVVCNSDVAWTYKHLIAPQWRRKYTNKKIDSMSYSMSLFVHYFGTKKTYPDLAHHTILLGPRYRGLLDDIFQKKRLADDFSLYLHAPTRTDPSLAPPGGETLYVLSPVPHLAGTTDWRSESERYRDKILAYLERTVMPGLGANLATQRSFTPLDFRDQLNSHMGAAFSVEPVLWQSAYFRPHNQSEDVEGLYFVGAGTHPGAGMPGVLCSAKVLDRVVPHARELAYR
jgi:phytoene desaturase